jgi:hypothetical protein
MQKYPPKISRLFLPNFLVYSKNTIVGKAKTGALMR